MKEQTYTVTIDSEGNKRWYNEQDLLHREDGPAIEYADGDKWWYLNDKQHRDDGPAIEFADGSKFWFLNDKTHREDGPAVEWADGRKLWYLNDEELTEEQFNTRTQKQVDSCDGKVVEVDGKKYKLSAI